MSRASYTIISASPAVVLLTDNKTSTSVTNDAEAVVAEVLASHGSPRIFYRDTEDRWGELKHDGSAFTGFASMAADVDPTVAAIFCTDSTFSFADLDKGKIITFDPHAAPCLLNPKGARLAP